jgi:hypothetical protein
LKNVCEERNDEDVNFDEEQDDDLEDGEDEDDVDETSKYTVHIKF